jgi:2-polyprenyl-6-methoxyphenol hydroxylase-like FAD-dependent oxidoreductase
MKVIIVGAGIGGLVAALYLDHHNIPCEIHERADELRERGVGLSLLPHAVTALDDLGIISAIDAVAIRAEYFFLRTRRGQTCWEEPRGLAAGYDVPQFAVHRGRLQGVLYKAVKKRLPPGSIHLDHHFVSATEDADGIEAVFSTPKGDYRARGDVVIGADGIHSGVRRYLYPDEGEPKWSGRMLWRGATDWPVFRDGRTVIISGGSDKKFVVYPIGDGLTPDTRLTNWAAVIRLAAPGSPPPHREDWSRPGVREHFADALKDFTVPEVDIVDLVAATREFWDFPMCDREPLPRWSFGRITLLGDAAHPMYPFGANGAAQAILDAKTLAERLAVTPSPIAALALYEDDRREKANQVVAVNRTGGPEAVIDAVESRAPNGFDDIDDVLPYEERKAIVKGYSRTAGFSQDQLVKA